MKYLKLLRVKHYIKNFLIFLPIIFSGMLLEPSMSFSALCGFICFCLMSSVIYIINDIKDIEKDRLHETKRLRPLAAGKISVQTAIIIAASLFLSSLFLNHIFFGSLTKSWIILLGYFFINIWYSVLGAKNIPLLDVILLSFGFVLRVVYGGVVTNISISDWLYLVIFSGAFFLGFGKRRNEILRSKNNTRNVLQLYSQNFLDKAMYCCMTLAIIFYSLWCMEKQTANFLLSVPILMILCFKYCMDIEGESDGDPVEVILKDRCLILIVIIFVIILLLLLYLQPIS